MVGIKRTNAACLVSSQRILRTAKKAIGERNSFFSGADDVSDADTSSKRDSIVGERMVG